MHRRVMWQVEICRYKKRLASKMYWNMRNIPLLQVTLATNLRLNRPGNVLASETY